LSDFFDQLAIDALATIKSGYYQNSPQTKPVYASFVEAILNCKANPVITEIKAASPSAGTIRASIKPAEIAQAMQQGGAIGLSVLTEPKHFNGSLQTLAEARLAVNLPILMKDIILDPVQIEAAAKMGANAVLLIEALYMRGYGKQSLTETISLAHSMGLEVLLETHSEAEYQNAVVIEADLIGINNRDLGTLQINLATTEGILKKNKKPRQPVVSESGLKTAEDLRFLRDAGADAYLVGSSIMLTQDIETKVKEFVQA
jgi:indole-3-glycerol phosphate synthase